MWNLIAEKIIGRIIDKWVLSGHNLSGSYIDSLESEITRTPEIFRLRIMGLPHGHYMNKGVRAEKIPYTPKRRGQGTGGTSKYITGLINYVQMRMGITGDRGKSIAFAIAKKHSKMGILGSEFLDKAIAESTREIDEMITKELGNEIIKNL